MTEYLDRYPTMHEYAEGKRINPKLTDYISRADAIKAIRKCKFESDMPSDWYIGMECAQHIVETRPSADADGEDLIIKGAKGIQDGLYNIKDGKLFKYKANGGTVRTYPIVPSADAVQGDECDHCVYKWETKGGDDE